MAGDLHGEVEVAGWRLRFLDSPQGRRGHWTGPFAASAGPPDLTVEARGPAASIRVGDETEERWRVPLTPSLTESTLAIAITVQAALAGALVFHSSAVLFRGRALLALAPSGGGKSTFATLLADLPLLSDEFNVLRRGPGGALLACSTPVRSNSPRPPENHTAPLGALLFLEKSEADRLEPLAPDAALRLLAGQTVAPDVPDLKPPFSLLVQVAREVPAFRFHFRKDPACRRLLDQLPAWT